LITYRCLGRNGNLGNQLWQIASTIGIARTQAQPAGFPFWRYQRHFSLSSAYFPDLATVDGDDLGDDWLQELRYFMAVEPLIKELFSPDPGTWTRINERHRDVVAIPHKTAVHVRRGDYLTMRDLYVIVGMDYYEEAMATTSPPYLVFSDDIAWCKTNFPRDCLFMEHNRDYEDLFLMADCDAVVTANSSFSWWGAWLSAGRRIYPARWFTAKHGRCEPRIAKVRPELMFPPGAEVIDN
jgi:hypothetical protein